VKLLFDENLSHRLVVLLEDLFPASQHVRDCALRAAVEAELWDYGKNNGFAIVTKDSDFQEKSVLLGAPPKIIWLRTRNCSTADIAALLRIAAHLIARFSGIEEETCLILDQRVPRT
jgi:predicted nuclease of predicted toxin-antitoxin system